MAPVPWTYLAMPAVLEFADKARRLGRRFGLSQIALGHADETEPDADGLYSSLGW
jgi:hypothetical protein